MGKPLRYGLKGEWSVRISSYRLIYAVQGDRLILLRFEHRKEGYEQAARFQAEFFRLCSTVSADPKQANHVRKVHIPDCQGP